MEQNNTNNKNNSIIGLLAIVIIVFILCTLFFKLVISRSHILSGSMEPTLETGCNLAFSRLSYKIGNVKRGDIAIFNTPNDKDYTYVKRIIGLPGEIIEQKDGVTYINGKPIKEDYVAFILDDESTESYIQQYIIYYIWFKMVDMPDNLKDKEVEEQMTESVKLIGVLKSDDEKTETEKKIEQYIKEYVAHKIDTNDLKQYIRNDIERNNFKDGDISPYYIANLIKDFLKDNIDYEIIARHTIDTVDKEELKQLAISFINKDYGPYEIPDNCYFVMGDNRLNSSDSRYWENRYVDESTLVGKVLFKYKPNFKMLNKSVKY